MENITLLFKDLSDAVWGVPLLILLVGTGVLLTLRLNVLQMSKLGLAFKLMFKKSQGSGDVSAFASLCTALASTVGTGNIIGVTTAIAMGGPGALFWMWLAAFFGMATKFAEGLLSVKYRITDENGQMSGGPMYYIKNGMGEKFNWLAKAFALFATLAALLGIGNLTQVDSINKALFSSFGVPIWITTIVLVVLVGIITIGGINSISRFASFVVPFMAAFYLLGSILVLVFNASVLPSAIGSVFKYAFTTHAQVGGFAGATVMLAIRSGVARGLFSNESGLGSAPIAAAAAKTNSPVEQGLVMMIDTFVDTFIICTMTGLTLIVSGAWNIEGLKGVQITNHAFSSGIPFTNIGELIVTIGIVFFAFTTIIGWNYYGEKAVQFLLGTKYIKYYKILFLLLMFVTAFNINLDLIWAVADIANGLMALPNLIAILFLSNIIIKETKNYFKSNQ